MNSAVKQLRTDLTNSEDAELADVLEAYFQALESGAAPSVEELLAQHPALADRLQRCLASLQFVEGAASQMVLPAPLDDLADENRRLGDYRLIREIGRGGMVLPFASVLDARQLQRFQNEALAAANLDHPNIVAVHGVGCERGVHFYVMRLISGATLEEVIESRRNQESGARSHEGKREANRDGQAEAPAAPSPFLSSQLLTFSPPHLSTSPVLQAALSTVNSGSSKERFRRLAALGIEAAEALEHAHQMGVVHRDIKPSNLLLDERGKLWVTDFGLAQVESNATLTLPGDLLGTLRYMSPEQAAGRPTMIDHRTDIYSLGATLYELATDRPVVQGQERAAILREIAETDPAPPRKLTPAMPADFETILLKCLAKEPSDRYDSSQALADDLRRFLEQKPVVARVPSAASRLQKWARRNMEAVAATIGVLLLGSVGLATATALIDRERSAALRNADKADANYRLALGALEATLVENVIGDLSSNDATNEQKRELLQRGIQFYEELARQNHLDLAEVRTYQQLLRTHYFQMADARNADRQFEISRQYYLQSIDKAKEIVQRFCVSPGDHEPLPEVPQEDYADGFALANCLNGYALHLFDAGDLDESRRYLLESRALYERIQRELPNDAQLRYQLGVNYYNMGKFESAAGLTANMELSYLTAEEYLGSAVQQEPEQSRYRRILAMCRYNLGSLYGTINRKDEAAEMWRKSLADWRLLAEDYPRVSENHSRCGATLHNLGVLELQRNEPTQARALLEEALTHQKRALSRKPVYELAHQFRAQHVTSLKEALTRLGDVSALAALEKESDRLAETAASP